MWQSCLASGAWGSQFPCLFRLLGPTCIHGSRSFLPSLKHSIFQSPTLLTPSFSYKTFVILYIEFTWIMQSNSG